MIKKWVINWTCHLVRALVGLAAVFLLGALIVFLTGSVGNLNNWLNGPFYIFGAPWYHPEMGPDVMWSIMKNYYGFAMVILVIVGVLSIGIIIFVAVKLLSIIGRWVLRLGRVRDWRDGSRMAVVALFVWTLSIISAWLILNAPNTALYLLTMLGLLIANLILIFIATRLANKWTINEL